MDIVVDFDRNPWVGHRLAEELYVGLPVAVPDLGQDEPPALLGTVIARSRGALLGWATMFEPDAGVVTIQWMLMSRERERIVTGYTLARSGTAEEEDVLVRLFQAAATNARAAGCRALTWSDTEADLDARVAAALKADVHQDLGRDWSVSLNDWQPPADLPPIRTRRPDESSLDLLTPEGNLAARLTAVVSGTEAYVEKVIRDDADEAELTALLTTFIDHLKTNGITLLQVRELNDDLLAHALNRTGLHITDRWREYRLPL